MAVTIERNGIEGNLEEEFNKGIKNCSQRKLPQPILEYGKRRLRCHRRTRVLRQVEMNVTRLIHVVEVQRRNKSPVRFLVDKKCACYSRLAVAYNISAALG